MAERATPSQYRATLAAIGANRSLPMGKMSGADWKRLAPSLMPQLDVSHLKDDGQYYKNQLAAAPSEARLSPARRVISPSDYPQSLAKSIFHTNSLRSHPDFDAAKHDGDADAAMRLVNDVLKPAVVDRIRALLDVGKPTYIVPVMQRESESANAIPAAYAIRLAEMIGAKVWGLTVKKAGTHNTGATANERTRNVQTFGGRSPGKNSQVIILDDTFTSGDTFTALIDRLAEAGVTPVAATTLANGRYQSDLSPTNELREQLLAKSGMTEVEFEDEFGYGTSHLTGSEIRAYLHNGGRGRGGVISRFPARGIQQNFSEARGDDSDGDSTGRVRRSEFRAVDTNSPEFSATNPDIRHSTPRIIGDSGREYTPGQLAFHKRDVLKFMSSGTLYQFSDKGKEILRSPLLRRALILEDRGDFFNIVTSRPDKEGLVGRVPDWRGRLTFPLPEAATASTSASPSQTGVASPSELSGLEDYSSSDFNATPITVRAVACEKFPSNGFDHSEW